MTKTIEQPFKSKAERELERALTAKYRDLGNPELLAAMKQQQASQEEKPVQSR